MQRHASALAVMAAAVLCTFALVPAAAAAGGYDVYACDPSIAGGANNSFTPVDDGGMTAYTYCPPGQGLVARNIWDNGQTPFLQGAYTIFDAPPGTYVESIAFQAGLKRKRLQLGPPTRGERLRPRRHRRLGPKRGPGLQRMAAR